MWFICGAYSAYLLIDNNYIISKGTTYKAKMVQHWCNIYIYNIQRERKERKYEGKEVEVGEWKRERECVWERMVACIDFMIIRISALNA